MGQLIIKVVIDNWFRLERIKYIGRTDSDSWGLSFWQLKIYEIKIYGNLKGNFKIISFHKRAKFNF